MLAVATALAVLGSACTLGDDRKGPRKPAERAPRIEGWLRTVNGRIVDAKGRPIRFMGVDDGRMNPGAGNVPTECGQDWGELRDSEFENVAAFGFNSIRLGVTWANLEPDPPTRNPDGSLTHHWNEKYLTALDRVVQEFGARQVAVILDMHQAGWSPGFDSRNPNRCEGSGMPVWLYPEGPDTDGSEAKCNFFANRAEPGVSTRPRDGFISAWKFLAARYGDNPTVVAADMLNEPPSVCDGDQVEDFYLKVGLAIRKVNPKILLIYEDNAYTGYSKYGFLLNDPLPLPNTVYSWHFYPPDWKSGRRDLEKHLERARRWNVPFWIGEFNAFHYATGEDYPATWAEDLRQMMEFCAENDIGWSLWEYGHYRNSALVDRKGQVKQELLEALQSGF